MNVLDSDSFENIKSFLSLPEDPFAFPEQTNALESELARVFDVKNAIVVSSGTAAIHNALEALDIGPGDEVLVPALSVIMSIVPILYQRACPIFVDSKSERIDFDYNDLERKISPRTKAVIPVYLWGCSYNLDNLMNFARDYKIAIIEDACQAHGSRWKGKYLGTWGDIGCFSMKEGKLLSTGEGGFILTNNFALAKKCRAFRNHWFNSQDSKESYNRIGWNYRLSELQALIGRMKLNCFDKILRLRKWQTEYIVKRLEKLSQLDLYKYEVNEEPNHFNPVLLLKDQYANKTIFKELSIHGVINSVGTFGLKPAQNWPIFKRREATEMPPITPNTENFLNRVIAPVLLLHYSKSKLDSIVETIKSVLKENMTNVNKEMKNV